MTTDDDPRPDGSISAAAGGREAAAFTTWDPHDPRVEDALRDADLGDLRPVHHSSNYVFIADLVDAALGPGTAVYKPRRGEQPLRDFPDGLYEREIAAFELSRLLGWDIVPPTVERSGPHGVGSMQLFIAHDPSEHYFALRERDALDEQLVRIAVFDLIANNADRKGGHVLLDPDAHLWGIDNGLCFHAQRKLRTVIWDYAGTAIPEPWLADIRRACALLEGGDAAAVAATAALRTRIAERELAALLRRCASILDAPVLPEMYTDYRCVPWPMI